MKVTKIKDISLTGCRVITIEDLPELVPKKIEQCSQSFLHAAFEVANVIKEVDMEFGKLVLIHEDGSEYPFSIPQIFNGVEMMNKSLDSEDEIVAFIKAFLLDTINASKKVNINTTNLKVLIKNLKQIDFFFNDKVNTIDANRLIDIFDKS